MKVLKDFKRLDREKGAFTVLILLKLFSGLTKMRLQKKVREYGIGATAFNSGLAAILETGLAIQHKEIQNRRHVTITTLTPRGVHVSEIAQKLVLSLAQRTRPQP